MDQLSSLPSQPSQLPLISRLAFKPQGFPGRRKERFQGIAPHSELGARSWLACSACQNSGASNHFLCLFLPFLSPLPYLPFCLPLLLFSVSPLPIPPLSSPSVLVFLSPSLGPDSYGFQVPHSYFRYNKTEARRGSQ